MIKVGIIGCGKIAQVRHIPEYIANKDADIAGYYDLNYERACGLARKYGGTAYKTMGELLENPQIDAVSVCVANNAHAKVTIQALSSGKHVLCEKPMAVTMEECEQMVETANWTGKKLMIGQNQRLARTHVKAKELIRDGLIGKGLRLRLASGMAGRMTGVLTAGRQAGFSTSPGEPLAR